MGQLQGKYPACEEDLGALDLRSLGSGLDWIAKFPVFQSKSSKE